MTTRRRWIAAWLAGPAIGIANGAARDLFYKDRIGERAAQQVSTATLLALFAAYFAWLERRWPLPDARTAWAIGGTWASLTVGFEFAFGHYVAHDSWRDLVEAYDVTKGRAWPLVPLWLGVGPTVARRVHARPTQAL